MYTFDTATGQLYQNRDYVCTGYSGHGPAKDNPADQAIPNCGPIPEGLYTIAPPIDHPKLGPVAIPLRPDPRNAMFGRSGFWIHGDSATHPGQASDGCIVLPHFARASIALSGDTALNVVRNPSSPTD